MKNVKKLENLTQLKMTDRTKSDAVKGGFCSDGWGGICAFIKRKVGEVADDLLKK